MSDEKQNKMFSNEELAKIAKVLKNDPGMKLGFAFGVGEKPTGSVFALHRILEGKKIAEKMKSSCDVSRVHYGKAAINGKQLNLFIESDGGNPSSAMRKYLSAPTTTLPVDKVKVFSADGKEMAETPDADSKRGDAPESPPNVAQGRNDSPPVEQNPSSDAWSKLNEALVAGTAKVNKVLKAVPGGKGVLLPILKKVSDAVGEQNDKNLEIAREGLQELTEALKDLVERASKVAAASKSWAETRGAIEKQISELEAAIRKKLPNSNTHQSELTRFVFEYFADLADPLSRAAQGSEEDLAAASVLVDAYLNEVGQQKVFVHLEGNPFVKLDIVGPVSQALTGIRQQLVA